MELIAAYSSSDESESETKASGSDQVFLENHRSKRQKVTVEGPPPHFDSDSEKTSDEKEDYLDLSPEEDRLMLMQLSMPPNLPKIPIASDSPTDEKVHEKIKHLFDLKSKGIHFNLQVPDLQKKLSTLDLLTFYGLDPVLSSTVFPDPEFTFAQIEAKTKAKRSKRTKIDFEKTATLNPT